jgi:hypothetical protein
MALSFEEMNILGNIINDTYGKSSTTGGRQKVPGLGGYSHGSANSVATKVSLDGNIMRITSLAIINLGHIGMQHQEIAKCENELNQYIKKYLSEVKKQFKNKDHAGRALKAKLIKGSENTNVEMINHYATTRRAYVRRTIAFEIA